MDFRAGRMQTLAALTLIAFGGVISAQAPTFDAASVKPHRSTGDQGDGIQFRPGGFSAINATLKQLIALAYAIEDLARGDGQIEGGPSWIRSERFDVIASGGGTVSSDHNRLLLRSLLADRFKVVVHNQARNKPVYVLVMDRSDRRLGTALHRVSEECSGLSCGFRSGAGMLRAGSVTIAQFANVLSLSRTVDRVVVDRTLLPGHFGFELTWTPEAPPRAASDASGTPSSGGGGADQSGPSVFTAIREQLGLKLEAGVAPVDILVIDRAEPPTED
jgi:uncharacterized protein (TIGR03435 family)